MFTSSRLVRNLVVPIALTTAIATGANNVAVAQQPPTMSSHSITFDMADDVEPTLYAGPGGFTIPGVPLNNQQLMGAIGALAALVAILGIGLGLGFGLNKNGESGTGSSGGGSSDDDAPAPVIPEPEIKTVTAEGDITVGKRTVELADPAATITVSNDVPFEAVEDLVFLGLDNAVAAPLSIEADPVVAAEGVTLTYRFEEPLPEDAQFNFAFWEEELGIWLPVETTIAADRMSATAVVDHLSFWTAVGDSAKWVGGKVKDVAVGAGNTVKDGANWIKGKGGDVLDWADENLNVEQIYKFPNQVFGHYAETPTCTGDTPSWSNLRADRITTGKDGFADAVKFCAGHSPRDPNVLEVRAAVNRNSPFTMKLSNPDISPSVSLGQDVGALLDFVSNPIGEMGEFAVFWESLENNLMMFPGRDVVMHFTKQDFEASGGSITLTAEPVPVPVRAGYLFLAHAAGSLFDKAMLEYAAGALAIRCLVLSGAGVINGQPGDTVGPLLDCVSTFAEEAIKREIKNFAVNDAAARKLLNISKAYSYAILLWKSSVGFANSVMDNALGNKTMRTLICTIECDLGWDDEEPNPDKPTPTEPAPVPDEPGKLADRDDPVVDTDGDGAWDGIEIYNGTDPNFPDDIYSQNVIPDLKFREVLNRSHFQAEPDAPITAAQMLNLGGRLQQNWKSITSIEGIQYSGHLTELNLMSNEITSLPESFGNLTRLQTVELGSNKLTRLPESFGNLANLANLNLMNNKLTSLPDSLGDITSLGYFNAQGNQLTALPDSFGRLVNITTLHVEVNELTSLPESIGNLTRLQHFNLSVNKLVNLPDSFGDLDDLASLNLAKNQLTSLPESFGSLTSLSNLDLRENKLRSLPESFGKIRKLHTLNLESNELTGLPESFRNLTNLRYLNVRENSISSLPEYLHDNRGLRIVGP